MLSNDLPNIVAVDLGAESCRVSLLQWTNGVPRIDLVHRFRNAPIAHGDSLHWELDHIVEELQIGLARCAERCRSIASVGVDGWAVDYVRLGAQDIPLSAPRCYRDLRTEPLFAELQERGANADFFHLTGVQPLRINTLYQLMADQAAGISPDTPWVNLPEYVTGLLAGQLVSEYTNATHTGLVDALKHAWCDEVFDRCGLSLRAAPRLVETGTELGRLHGPLKAYPAFEQTRLIAPACHDTASAVAAIALDDDGWAYISSGTWSLVGTLIERPLTTTDAYASGFTNLGAAGGRTCFHKNVNGMWLVQQTMKQLYAGNDRRSMAELISAAERAKAPDGLLDVDAPELLLPGAMASSINAQRLSRGLAPIEEYAASAPVFASLIFHSLAAHYAVVLRDLERLTGKSLRRLAIVGGGSQNQLLNRLTAETTGLELYCGVPESSTIGNFAVQLATLDGQPNAPERVAYWARALTGLRQC
ncbi:MAG TPA: FGGY-family carbohydrate kinase [Acidobacteriaceae bacterium]|jgi:rhamnulokinase